MGRELNFTELHFASRFHKSEEAHGIFRLQGAPYRKPGHNPRMPEGEFGFCEDMTGDTPPRDERISFIVKRYDFLGGSQKSNLK
jgi:hypothetical protein